MEFVQEGRALLLLQQGKYSLAEKEFRNALANDIENGYLHTNLALTLLKLKRHKEAQAEAETAISLEPELDAAHYVLSLIHLEEGNLQEAEAAIDEAIRLNVNDPDYWDTAAIICFNRKEWGKALSLAEKGLSIDPEHVDCLNTRARALNRLGLKTEASESFANSFRQEPENYITHINQGYVHLEQLNHKEALQNFQEALRLNPESDEAREGLVQALKAKYWIYRGVMELSFRISNMSSGARYGMFFGIYVFVRFLPVLLPLYLLLVFFNWFADLIFNSLLRLNRYGRNALSKEDKNGSTAFLLMLTGGVGGIIVGEAYDAKPVSQIGFVILALLFPLSGTLSLTYSHDRKKSIYAGLGLAALGLIAVITAFIALELNNVVFGIFLLCTFGYTWYRQSF